MLLSGSYTRMCVWGEAGQHEGKSPDAQQSVPAVFLAGRSGLLRAKPAEFEGAVYPCFHCKMEQLELGPGISTAAADMGIVSFQSSCFCEVSSRSMSPPAQEMAVRAFSLKHHHGQASINAWYEPHEADQRSHQCRL